MYRIVEVKTGDIIVDEVPDEYIRDFPNSAGRWLNQLEQELDIDLELVSS